MGWWIASEEGMVPCVRLVTLPLLLVISCGRWWVPWLVNCIWGRYGALRKFIYSPLDYGCILWKVKSTLGWWVASEGGMVPCVRLGISPCFWLHPMEGEEYLRLVSCIWGRYVALVMFRTLILLLITSCRRWGAQWASVDELHLIKVRWHG